MTVRGLGMLLCLTAVPAWCGQSDKPSPFEVKTREKKKPRSLSATTGDVPGQPVDPSGNTGLATFFKSSGNARDRMASGEMVDDDDLTAAHMTLPLGSSVRVVNLANNRSVVVRITDRGSFPPGRIISVNYRAAKELDFLKSGTTRVRLESAETPRK